jgi:hypothetical protein
MNEVNKKDIKYYRIKLLSRGRGNSLPLYAPEVYSDYIISPQTLRWVFFV